MTTTSSVSGSQPIVSVASSNSAGAAGGSVINVSQLVSELVTATQQPQETLISNQTQAVTAQISAVGTLKSALSTFQSSLAALDTPSAFGTQAASSSDPTAFTATAGSDATLGSYSVAVTQLAQAQQLVSSAFTGGSSATVGTGTLQLSLGGTSFTVTISDTDNTVAGIAGAINSATGNPGIEASVVTGTDGAHLVLTSTLTGASNTIQVAETDTGGGLSQVTYGTGNTGNYTEPTGSTPQDAEFSVAGVPYTSASNTVTDALSGITLNLAGTTTSPATLTVATDDSSTETNVATFVAAYNTMQQALASLGSYDSTTSTAGPLMGNPLLLGIQNELQSALYSIVNTGSSTYNSLASVGITTNSDGSLSLNQDTLAAALSSNFSAVSSLFSGTSGVATSLNSQINADLDSGGPIASSSQTLVSQENALTQQSAQLQQQMTALSASLTQQYSSLNTLLSSLQTTSSYLTQAFASLPQVQGTQSA